ncbi:MAG: BCD family MFS transporter [Caldilineaceae bacterium]|nr:BCD family MFS transporter [Caldilineaceae bacterium]
MSYLKIILRTLAAFLKTFRLALPKIGVGWMFALLTIDFNRIAIVELGVTAVLITTMLGLHYFLSPFQVIVGRVADHHPVAGLRRTPYLILGSIVASLVFLALPSVAQAMGTGSLTATVTGFLLLALFGISIAIMGDSHHSLIAEVTTERARGGVISVVWTFTILSTILAAVVMNIVRPEYTPEAMQRLYNLTPFIVIGSTLLGVIGIEKRLRGTELAESVARAKAITPPGNPLRTAYRLLQEDPQARGFFFFIFVSIFAIFLQDNILEVFGAEVFGMSVEQTTSFQPTWGGGVLLGMVAMGLISVIAPISKKNIALVGCVGTAVGMGTLAMAALTHQVELVKPALFGMGLFTGFFNVGSLSMMMDMTVEGATGLYMGLWGVAQAFGNGSSSIGSGLLHTGLIENGILAPNAAYFAIFGFEAIGMMVAAAVLVQLSVQRFREMHSADLTSRHLMQAMEAGASA